MILKYLVLSFLIFFNCQAMDRELTPREVLIAGSCCQVVTGSFVMVAGFSTLVNGAYNLSAPMCGVGTVTLLLGAKIATSRIPVRR